MKKRAVFITGLLMSIILTLIVFLYDSKIIKFFSLIRTEYFDYLFLSVTFASNTFIIFFFLTTLFLWKEHKRKWILPLWLSSLFAGIISYLLKVMVMRSRPFQEQLISVLQIAFHFMRNNFLSWNTSFPSFQAMLVFAALPILNKEFRKFKYVWFVFACLVGFSRVYFGVHYLSDVLAGAIIGYLIGFAMMKLEEKYNFGLSLMRKLRISN
ncbi:MAG: phosphatase PAP2 family protein [Nanoarchaeota archaeon]